jgi:tetratricopeptide (TPR) repeat protein
MRNPSGVDARPRLYLNHDVDFDWLRAVEFGRVTEDQPADRWQALSPTFAFLTDEPGGRVVGFVVEDFPEFDEDAPEHAAIWREPRFDAPVLGLSDATAGEIVLAARTFFAGRDSINRSIFGMATEVEGEEAVERWRHCLEAGDGMAHFALGYTLFELGRHAEAYRHLRHYTEIAPMGAWNWCWYGRAAEATGEIAEARAAYHRAIELEEDDDEGEQTDAAERLMALGE